MCEPAGISFTRAQLAECDAHHTQPLLGCPVCFLYLVYSQPMIDVGVATVREVAGTGCGAAKRMLRDFRHIRAQVVGVHLERPMVGVLQ